MASPQELLVDPSLPPPRAVDFAKELADFAEFGQATRVTTTEVDGISLPTFVNEFWTAKQRAASTLHEISYRACFKPQLPRFFIERLTRPGDAVYDPFMGRGTTCLEAGLLGRVPFGCDINPLSRMLVEPRLVPPRLEAVEQRLAEIDFAGPAEVDRDLLVFYHPETLSALCALRTYLLRRVETGLFDAVDGWIRMVALNRLTGHSVGFFSVYTLPPNQAASLKAQARINRRRDQTPPPRDVRALIQRKSKQLLKDVDDSALARLASVSPARRLLTGPAAQAPEIPSGSVALACTSPPFLDVVDYAGDNWLRWWFGGIHSGSVKITMAKNEAAWETEMCRVFKELMRILRPGGHVAFEVGEVRSGAIRLEEAVVRSATKAGLRPRFVLINDQEFTKTSNCWGVSNGRKGTNTNRVVVLQKAE